MDNNAHTLTVVFGVDAVNQYADGQHDIDALTDLGQVAFYGFKSRRDRRMFLLGMDAAVDHWAYITADEIPLVEQDVEHVMQAESDEPLLAQEAPLTLIDWRSEDGSSPANPLDLTLTVAPERLDIRTEDGRSIWIEVEGKNLRIHAYSAEEDEPLSVNISKYRVCAVAD